MDFKLEDTWPVALNLPTSLGFSGNTSIIMGMVYQCLSDSIATTSDSGANCNAVGGTLGTLVIVLVLLLSGAVAALVYFLKKEFKFNCKLRLQAAKSPRAQPETPEQRRSVG